MDAVQRHSAWATVAIFAAIGLSSLLPPAPVSATAPATVFSSERALADVAAIAAAPHPMGSPAIAEVRSYIVTKLEDIGLAPEYQTIQARTYYGTESPVEITNIVATIEGSAPSRAVALMAHYDTVPTTPGANDNSVAVATLLETARAVVAGPRLQNDVVLMFTDGEEPWQRWGSTALLGHPVVDNVGFVINLEAAGGTGASILVEASGSTSWAIGQLVAATTDPVAFSFVTDISRLIGDVGTDFDSFRNAGFAGFHFAYFHDSSIYHTAADDLESVGHGSLQHHGLYALGLARQLGNVDLTAIPDHGDSVFFTVGPLFFRYPEAVAVPLAVLASIAFIWSIVRSGEPTNQVAKQAIRATFAVASSAAMGTVLWMVVVALRPTPGVAESYLYLGCLLAVSYIIYDRLNQNQGVVTLGAIVLLWTVFGLLTALTSPGFSYLFVWPALTGAVVLGVRTWSKRRPVSRLVVVAAPTLLLAAPAIDFIFQMAQPRPGNLDSQVPYVIVVALFLALLAMSLLRSVWPEVALPRPQDDDGDDAFGL